MKSLEEIQTNLLAFETRFGVQVLHSAQGSPEWLQCKLGVLSASNASKIVAKIDSETRLTYMAGLVAQVATGLTEEINARAMEWGKAHEDAARSSYEFVTGATVAEVPFVFMDNSFRVGCSPDGLIFAANRGKEIKCPYDSANYIKFLCEDKIKSEWDWQVQMSMHVTGAETWDFGQYDPRMKSKPLHFVTIERDEKKQKTLADAIPQFVSDMDKMLAKAGVKFGDQWLRLKEQGVAV